MQELQIWWETDRGWFLGWFASQQEVIEAIPSMTTKACYWFIKSQDHHSKEIVLFWFSFSVLKKREPSTFCKNLWILHMKGGEGVSVPAIIVRNIFMLWTFNKSLIPINQMFEIFQTSQIFHRCLECLKCPNFQNIQNDGSAPSFFLSPVFCWPPK